MAVATDLRCLTGKIASEEKSYFSLKPIITKTASIWEVDDVIVTGIREGTCLNIDGNPLALVGPGDEVRMRYVPGAARR